MASPSGKGSWTPEAPGFGPRALARDLVDSVDDAEGLYVAVERCPLCNTTRRRLTCAKCVQSGDFVYFDGRDRERYGGRHGPYCFCFSGSSGPATRGWSLDTLVRAQEPGECGKENGAALRRRFVASGKVGVGAR